MNLLDPKIPQGEPEAPTLKGKTKDSVKLNDIPNAEYRCDNGAWQSSTIFSGLKPNTTYKFYTRMKETDTQHASLESPPFTVLTSQAQEVGSFSTKPMIAAGYLHTAALKNDGTVWSFGDNRSGQLGDGTTTNCPTPVQVSGLNNITAIAVKGLRTVVLKSDGTVWSFGDNEYGELGDGTTTNRSIPVQAPGLSNVTAIAAGWRHTVALKSDGTVWSFGYNGYGQLGDGTTTNRIALIQVSGLSNVIAIEAGNSQTVALKSDGTVWYFGNNVYGQLGGTTEDCLSPVQVPGLSGVIAITAGSNHIVVLKSDGTVWSFGDNSLGQLGDGTTTDRTTPVQALGLNKISAIAAGSDCTIALKSDGTVWSFGHKDFGQLGDATIMNHSALAKGGATGRSTPMQVSGLKDVTAIAAGSYHTVVLKKDGTVWGFGDNYYGQLGGDVTERYTKVRGAGDVGYLNLGKIKLSQDAPQAPTLKAKTKNSVTLKDISGAEYRCDNGAWQSSTVFSGLKPNTSYKFYARRIATDIYNASLASTALTIITDKEVAKRSLPKPKGLKFTAKKATWKKVSNNNGYTLKIMQGKKIIKTVQIKKGKTSYKIPKKLLKKGNKYYITLVAKGTGNYKKSKSAKSKTIKIK